MRQRSVFFCRPLHSAAPPLVPIARARRPVVEATLATVCDPKLWEPQTNATLATFYGPDGPRVAVAFLSLTCARLASPKGSPRLGASASALSLFGFVRRRVGGIAFVLAAGACGDLLFVRINGKPSGASTKRSRRMVAASALSSGVKLLAQPLLERERRGRRRCAGAGCSARGWADPAAGLDVAAPLVLAFYRHDARHPLDPDGVREFPLLASPSYRPARLCRPRAARDGRLSSCGEPLPGAPRRRLASPSADPGPVFDVAEHNPRPKRSRAWRLPIPDQSVDSEIVRPSALSAQGPSPGWGVQRTHPPRRGREKGREDVMERGGPQAPLRPRRHL